MARLDRASEEHVRDVLKAASVARDQLPYTDEFGQLKEEFYGRTFKDLTDSEFWLVLVRVAKSGGVRGKGAVHSAPEMTEAEKESLKGLLPVGLGQIDQLPYTPRMVSLAKRFNAATGQAYTEHQLWHALLSLRK